VGCSEVLIPTDNNGCIRMHHNMNHYHHEKTKTLQILFQCHVFDVLIPFQHFLQHINDIICFHFSYGACHYLISCAKFYSDIDRSASTGKFYSVCYIAEARVMLEPFFTWHPSKCHWLNSLSVYWLSKRAVWPGNNFSKFTSRTRIN
jgi:hypothetical protein